MSPLAPRTVLLALLALVLPSAAALAASPPARLILAAGSGKIFLDEPSRPAVGSSLLLTLVPRVSLGPAFFFVPGDRFQLALLTADFAVDLSPAASRASVLLVGGVGLARNHEGAIDYSYNELALSVGLAGRIPIGRSVSLRPEVRLGTQDFPRITLGLEFPMGPRVGP